MPGLSRQEISDVCAVRLQLEPEAGRLACAAAPDETIAEVEAILKRTNAASSGSVSPLERLTTNREFHRAIYAATGNVTMTAILDSLWDRCDRYRLQLLKDENTLEASGREHDEMVAALQARDGARMADLTRHHLQSSAGALVQRLS